MVRVSRCVSSQQKKGRTQETDSIPLTEYCPFLALTPHMPICLCAKAHLSQKSVRHWTCIGRRPLIGRRPESVAECGKPIQPIPRPSRSKFGVGNGIAATAAIELYGRSKISRIFLARTSSVMGFFRKAASACKTPQRTTVSSV